MSVRLLLRLAAVLVVLLLLWGAAALAGRRAGGADAAGGSSRILGVDTAAVDSVLITGTRDTTVLARIAGGWRVNGYPVAIDEVKTLLEALADTSAHELVAESEGSHQRLAVDGDSGRKVRTVGGAKALEVVVGRARAGFGTGYVRRANEATVYLVRGRLPELAARSADEWRDKTVVALPPDSIAMIEVRRGREQYLLRRDGSHWRFASGAAADSGRAAELARELGQISAAGFATPDQAKSLRFNRPERRVTLKGRDGRTLAALVFDSTESETWVRHDSGGTVWRLESWDLDRITPATRDLR